jgi:exopolysaccharide biosynthesis polyprenyl glycosylphosphotransferase
MVDHTKDQKLGNMLVSRRSLFDVRRMLDILFSLILLVVLSPVLFILMLLIKVESPGPIFYRQERVGLYGKTFIITKLRSMRVDAEKKGPQIAAKNDPRVTRVGWFMRRTRLDEWPQLLNVLRGEMHLVGPRPERPMFTQQYARKIMGFKNRLKVRPGLTGWAQINGGNDVTILEKYKLDMYYIYNRSLLLDLKILFITIWIVFSGSGAR